MEQIKKRDPVRRKPLVKSSKQHKRKATEVTGKENDCSAVPVKKHIAGATEHNKRSQVQPQVQQQIPSAKIKLQLFPINDDIRLELEKDGYNPFLELALSHSKKISSVVRHLNSKWGSSSVATGHLMLFPYTIMSDQIASSPRWTLKDVNVTAGDVYNTVENPPVFRLRYAWGSTTQFERPNILSKSKPLEIHIKSQAKSTDFSQVPEIASLKEKRLYEASEDYQKQIDVNESLHLDMNEPKDAPNDRVVKIPGPDLNCTNKNSLQENGLLSDLSIGGLLSESSLLRKLCDNDSKSLSHSPFLLSCSDLSIGGFLSDSWLPNKSKTGSQPVEGESNNGKIASPWDDSFTCISMGGLFNEASLQAKIDRNNEVKENRSNILPNTPLSDSFDGPLNAPSCAPQSFSLFDAEETCHAFPILKPQSSNSKNFQFPSIAENKVREPLDFALPPRNITGSGGWH